MKRCFVICLTFLLALIPPARADVINELADIYAVYNDVVFEDIKDEYLRYELRLYALLGDHEENLHTLGMLENSDMNSPEFLAAFTEAMEWSKSERDKSGNQLFTLSQNLETVLPYGLQGRVPLMRYIYLKLASEKGYEPAKIAFQSYREQLSTLSQRDDLKAQRDAIRKILEAERDALRQKKAAKP